MDREELRGFYALLPRRIARDAFGTWAAILIALALAARMPHPVLLALAFVVVASRQLALSHLVHDAAHFNLSREKRWNDLMSDLFFAAPTLISTAAYRAQHQAHHAQLGDAVRDTDVRTWYNLRGANAVRRVLLTLLGGEALKTIASYSSRGKPQSLPETLRQGALIALTNTLLFAYCWLLGNPFVYFGLWLFPLFTLTVLLLTLRVIAEHQSVWYAAAGRDDFARNMAPPLVRTIEAGAVERFLIGSMNFCYHHEHHLYPAVPYPQLPRLHRVLAERGYYAQRPESLARSYAGVLRSLVRPGTAQRIGRPRSSRTVR